MRILLINPNTSPVVTGLLATHARRIAGTDAEIFAVTAPFGALALQSQHDLDDAAIVGAFGDPGLEASRAAVSFPVFGIGSCGLSDAARSNRRFSLITLGTSMRPTIEHMIERLGFGGNCAGIHFLDGGVLDVARDRARFLSAAAQTANDCVKQQGAEAILFGGAPFSGIGMDIASQVSVPVLDGLTSAVQSALRRDHPPGA